MIHCLELLLMLLHSAEATNWTTRETWPAVEILAEAARVGEVFQVALACRRPGGLIRRECIMPLTRTMEL